MAPCIFDFAGLLLLKKTNSTTCYTMTARCLCLQKFRFNQQRLFIVNFSWKLCSLNQWGSTLKPEMIYFIINKIPISLLRNGMKEKEEKKSFRRSKDVEFRGVVDDHSVPVWVMQLEISAPINIVLPVVSRDRWPSVLNSWPPLGNSSSCNREPLLQTSRVHGL